MIMAALPSSYVNRSGPLYVVMDGYLQVNSTQHYIFHLAVQNIGASFKINGHKVLDLPSQAEGKSTIRLVLQKEYIHRVLVEVQSFSNASKAIALYWKRSDDNEFKELTEFFYSYNGLIILVYQLFQCSNFFFFSLWGSYI